MNRAIVLATVLTVWAGSASVHATVAPKDGGPLPQAYLDRLASDRGAYQMQRAWVQKVQRIKEAREVYLERQVRETGPAALAAPLPAEFVVSGTIKIPVLLGYFQSQSTPYPRATLQNQLFDDPSGTVTDYYDEVSYGNLNLTGDLFGWTQVSNIDTYYAGPGFGLEPATDRLGQFIKELLDAHDGLVDFGQYDNDGPDGVPNSGDDDGYVDVAAFVHNEVGAECGTNNNIWSHRWVYQAWPASGGLPYTTDDAAAGGGFIKVNDYTVMPALNCGGGTVIDIGVFCHEFGHGLGLPDLYDYNGGGQGIGHWGIMGSGNWNTPSSPAHPCAWTREVLGWITPTEVDWTNASIDVPDINTNPVAYRLPFSDDRWRRAAACAIDGVYSLYCGLTAAEGTARNWVSPGPGGGYGCNWVETVERDFEYSGSGSVSLVYDYAYDIEPPFQTFIYDIAYAIIDVQGTESVLASYYGMGSGTETIDLSPYLTPLSGSGGAYTIKFRFTSDNSFADDDGNDPSACGAIAIDNVAVTGGGESYSTDFETWADGWHQDPDANPATEYWLVENRRRTGFDANLAEQGLLIMHIDQGVVWANYLGNSAGPSNNQTRGVVVEEANGDSDLNGAGANRGETTDPFPGTANVTSFTAVTNPNSNDNTQRATRIQVTNISAPAPTMSANMRAGDRPPQAAGIAPNDINNNEGPLQVAITGGFIRHGATFHLVPPIPVGAAGKSSAGAGDLIPKDVEWVDPTRLVGTINPYGLQGGMWDLVVTNPDGQTTTVIAALTINQTIVATHLQSASVEAVNGVVELRYELLGREPGETLLLYRSTQAGGGWRIIESDLRGDDHGVYRYRDNEVEPGATYHYLLVSIIGGEERELHRASATVPAGELTLSQNVPNPFNPTTSIRFFLPEESRITLQVYDVSGALVRELASGSYPGGAHDVVWNGRDGSGNTVGSGVYFYRLITGSRSLTRKMVLLK